MIDYLFAATLSNVLVSTALAVFAWVCQRRIGSPGLTNLLWVLVLVKLVTPPIVSLPVVTVPSVVDSRPTDVTPSNGASSALGVSRDGIDEFSHTHESLVADPLVQSSTRWLGGLGFISLLLTIWLVGSVLIAAVSTIRILKFHALLKATARRDRELTRSMSHEVARGFGLCNAPAVFVTMANIAPFVWWLAGECVIVISSVASQQLDRSDLRLVVTHEMAHIKRRDHWFRWLEWFALIAFWWNPIMWLARRQLRISEEMACDQMVLEASESEVHQYAHSLLNMAELLVSSAIRPPVVASAINSGGNLERRLNVMISRKSWVAPASLRTVVGVLALGVFPFGFVYAQDYESVERRLGGAVEAGELTLSQANAMMETLRQSKPKAVDSKMALKLSKELFQSMEAARESGKTSKSEALEKANAFIIEFAGQGEGGNEKHAAARDALKFRFEVLTEEMKQARAAAEAAAAMAFAKEQMMAAQEKKVQEERKMTEKEASNAAKENELKLKQGYEKSVRLMMEAQEAKKLQQLKEELERNDRFSKGADLKLDSAKKRYEWAVRALKEAREAGKISEEQAEMKLKLLLTDSSPGEARKAKSKLRSEALEEIEEQFQKQVEEQRKRR
ncbi:MAG: M56 family metallopeptidase [Planctomycetota bacterium]